MLYVEVRNVVIDYQSRLSDKFHVMGSSSDDLDRWRTGAGEDVHVHITAIGHTLATRHPPPPLPREIGPGYPLDLD